MPTPTPFVLPPMAIQALKESCRTYHGIWRQTKLTAHHLEEAVAKALEYYGPYTGWIQWHPNSHNAKADICILAPDNPLQLSIKSGTAEARTQTIHLSGHRLSRAKEDMNTINRLLREMVSDVVVCFVHNEGHRCYECLYIDAEVFVYPQYATEWTAQMGAKQGKVAQYVYRSPAGLVSTIKPAMSWQIWWTIPRQLCRQGPRIDYGH